MTVQPTRDQLRALADQATPGPWYAERRREDYYDLTTVYNVFHNGDTMDRDLVAEVAYDNAEFIAAAREAVPQLLEQLDQAEARIRDLAQEVRDERGAALDQMEQVRIRDARIKAVRELHSESRIIPDTPVFGCAECGEPNETEPCATIRALDT